MNILYVEDDSNDATLVSRYIQTTDHQLQIVSHVQDAWAVLETSPVDLILVDVLLANKRDGNKFASEVRATIPDLAVVPLTGLNTQEDINASKQAGFDIFLSKPFQITELSKIIQHYEA